MAKEGPGVYRPNRKLRSPPASLTPAQRQAFTRLRTIESFVKDFIAALPRTGGVQASAIEFPHYANFAKQVWRIKDLVPDSAERARQIDLKVGHCCEVLGLKEPVLRALATEILKTGLAAN